MAKLYRIVSWTGASEMSADSVRTVSNGYSSRASAERFAAALAQAGKCRGANISSYEDEDADEPAQHCCDWDPGAPHERATR